MLQDNYKHKGLRTKLIEGLAAKGIRDRNILNAFMKVPRHFFLDSTFISQAYQDRPFSIGSGQTISQPYTVAFQTALLSIQSGDKVLEIGSGSGFQSCILMELGVDLYSVEVIPKLHTQAKKMAQLLNYKGNFILGDGTEGLRDYAPYNKILVTAGGPIVPTPLIEQLSIGGSLVIPVGNDQVQQMLRLTKANDRKIIKENFGDFSFVKLKGKNGW